MFVRLLIGKAAGSVVDMPYHAATAGFAAGTCRAVTDLELRESGTDPGAASDIAPETVPLGYRVMPDEAGGGYDLFSPTGERVNLAPIRNLAAARSIAENHFARTQRMVDARKSQGDFADPVGVTVVGPRETVVLRQEPAEEPTPQPQTQSVSATKPIGRGAAARARQ